MFGLRNQQEDHTDLLYQVKDRINFRNRFFVIILSFHANKKG